MRAIANKANHPPPPKWGALVKKRAMLWLFPALLLTVLALFASPVEKAAAQSTLPPNDDGSYTVHRNWTMKPSGINPGDKFRLLFRTSQFRDATSTDIADYNTHVLNSAIDANAHTAIKWYNSAFKALACTASTDAHANIGTAKTGGVPIYWLNGGKVADDYADFYDGNWDAQGNAILRDERGMQPTQSNWTWTGCEQDGDSHANALCTAGQVR